MERKRYENDLSNKKGKNSRKKTYQKYVCTILNTEMYFSLPLKTQYLTTLAQRKTKKPTVCKKRKKETLYFPQPT